MNENGTPTYFTEKHAVSMTLRDYFAAKAMQSQILDTEEMKFWAEEYGIEQMIQIAAERAYEYADAMMKAREA